MSDYRNKHGRKPGRGLRPWLLLPKLFGIATYFGGLVCALALLCTVNMNDAIERSLLIHFLGNMFVFAIVPGLIVAMLMGALLLWHHGKPVWQMRWLRVKLTVVAVSTPLFHLLGRSLLHAAAQATDDAVSIAALERFRLLVLSAVVVTGVIIGMGRHKPRLGQQLGKRKNS